MNDWTPETLTDEIVEQSVMGRVKDMFGNEKDWVVFKSRLDMVSKLYGSRDINPTRQTLDDLWQLRDTIVGVLKRYSCCSEGCSWCCNMAVGITSLDAEIITKATGIQPKEVIMDVNGMLKERDDQIKKYIGVPCPFLRNKRCSIYEHRPSACRTHFNVSQFPQVCDLEVFVNRDVPNFDMQVLWMAEALICYKLGATMGDIRAYFPHVREGVVVPE